MLVCVCVCVRERERESVCVCVCVRESVCVCVYVTERQRVREKERECVCVCVCVTVTERDRVPTLPVAVFLSAGRPAAHSGQPDTHGMHVQCSRLDSSRKSRPALTMVNGSSRVSLSLSLCLSLMLPRAFR